MNILIALLLFIPWVLIITIILSVSKSPSWITGYNYDGTCYEPKGKWGAYASHLENYMHRWIIKTPWGSLHLHHILREDNDRDPHDHPWSFYSFILYGGYYEQRYFPMGYFLPNSILPGPIREYLAGSLVIRRAEDLHIITKVLPNTWTLVFCGSKRKEWGFFTKDGWINWRNYEGRY